MGKKGKGKKAQKEGEPVAPPSQQQTPDAPQQQSSTVSQDGSQGQQRRGDSQDQSQQQQRQGGSQQQRQGQPQQQQPTAPQQQGQHGAWQQRPSVPQQQGPTAPQQQRQSVPQQQGPTAPQQQRPTDSQQQGQRGPWQQRPTAPQQQGQRGPWQQRPTAPQQQGQRGPRQQTQSVPQQQGPTARQQQGPHGPWQQRQSVPQQQGPHGPWQQRQSVPQQQGPTAPQQQRPSVPQQQGPTAPQQQGLRGPWQQRPTTPQQGSQQQSTPIIPQQESEQQPEPSTPQQVSPISSAAAKQLETFKARPGSRKSVLPFSLQEMYLEQIPKRTSAEGGKAGRKIVVETNMFKINFPSTFKTDVVHYDVVIDPDKPKFLMRPIFEEFRKKYFPNRYPAYDGKKNAYSAGNLPFGDCSKEEEIQVFDEERQQTRTFRMYMKKAAVLDLSWLKNINYNFNEMHKEQQGIQALDIILRNGPAYHSITVGRSLFQHPEPGRVVSLSNGVDLWVGVFQSAVIGWKPYLNIDVAHKGFPTPQSVINLIKDLCKPPRSYEPLVNVTARDIQYNSEKITKFLKGLKVQYKIPGQESSKRTYRVNGLVECPRKNKFSLENGTSCTVEDYFSQQKGYRIQYPELPCLWVGSRTSTRKIHLPIELCTIVAGQVTQKKLDETQTSKMIREAATNTQTRKEKILSGFAKMRLNEQPTLMKEFNLSVSGEFEKVPARVLQAPRLRYDTKEPVNVLKGVWRADRFLKPSSLPENSWTILNLDKYTQNRDLYENLHDKLLNGAKFINMSIGKALTPFATLTIAGRNFSNISQYFEDQKKLNLRLVVVVIPNFDNAYSLVKQISELQIKGGIVTQCLKAQTLRKMSDATVTNILLKINSKLNGINHTFERRPPCLERPCMLVGADVTHPSPDAVDIPSIAAVAASHDPLAFQYNIELRLQAPREEMIQDLEAIMRKQLLFFYRQTGHKPEKVIFYRDGVSEGQLPQVMHFELNAIKKAIAHLEKSDTHQIPIIFLVVQKRHHVRLFPTDKRNSDDRNFNVQAGTIVDTTITHPTHIDFYLVSHASIQGTARPTKYRCICNEIGMSEDEIEQLTYYLCHMFARCTRSVSYPTPTYYAHLAAFRARALIHNVPLNMANLAEEQQKNMSLQMQNSPMFFV
ncbi:PREDICTED: protein argonaute-2 [Dufourea novaeangliae]|uniref:protein argonaute-2 n=1 Tax=Dufourea novaeangliae TaxID=178035 RepID=UPI0007675026|nr:PREDICTED: protein argonaute-2 [Dufourea novaeangliae]